MTKKISTTSWVKRLEAGSGKRSVPSRRTVNRLIRNKIIVNEDRTLKSVEDIVKRYVNIDSDSDVEMIGSGTSGTVWGINQNVAVKLIDVDENYQYEDKFSCESRACANKEIFMQHLASQMDIGPRLYGVIHDKPRSKVLFVMERMEDTLFEYLNRNVLKSEYDSIEKNLDDLITRLSTRGFRCTDLRLKNIMVTNGGRRIRLIDFGGEFCSQVDNIQDDILMTKLAISLEIQEHLPHVKPHIFFATDIRGQKSRVDAILRRKGSERFAQWGHMYKHYFKDQITPLNPVVRVLGRKKK